MTPSKHRTRVNPLRPLRRGEGHTWTILSAECCVYRNPGTGFHWQATARVIGAAWAPDVPDRGFHRDQRAAVRTANLAAVRASRPAER